MKLHSLVVAVAAVFVILGTGIASGQVATGTPAFGSFGGGPFDTVNLGNLNVHFSIPILNKSGRGTAFTYNLVYDSSLWTPVVVSGSTVWQPASNWGWQGQTEVSLGYISFTTVQTKPLNCGPGNGYASSTLYSNWAYRDKFGITHRFFGVHTSWQGCAQDYTSGSQTATDGSGYTLNATGPNGTITTPGGVVITPPANTQSGAGSFSDRNGNQITVNNSGQFFDTLSSTTPVLTVSGSGTPASPTEFQYSAPGGPATYKMNYTQYTVATNFGFSGSAPITEYGPLSNALASSITLPDGTSYQFTYETTPGSSCSPLPGTYANCVTGRIASIALPTGGTITYTYTGGTHNTGIYSDGSTATLTRVLTPCTSCGSGSWQYERSLLTGSPGPASTWTTTVIDPNSNDTFIDFSEDGNTTNPTYYLYETQRQVNQLINGTQTLLGMSARCYNTNYLNCSSAAVTSPITQTDSYQSYLQFPNTSTRLSEVLYNSSGLVTDDKEYNYGVALNAAPSSAYLVRETAIAYASLGNNIYNKPSSVTVYDWSSGTKTTLASSTYSYDQGTLTSTPVCPANGCTPQHIAITGSRGNLTTATTASLSRTYTYYDTGNLKLATDINGTTTTTYTYSQATQGSTTASCGNSFPTTVTLVGPLVYLSTSTVW